MDFFVEHNLKNIKNPHMNPELSEAILKYAELSRESGIPGSLSEPHSNLVKALVDEGLDKELTVRATIDNVREPLIKHGFGKEIPCNVDGLVEIIGDSVQAEIMVRGDRGEFDDT